MVFVIIKFHPDLLGGETVYEGKICRACLGKKQRGEVITPQEKPIKPAPMNLFPQYRRKSSMEDNYGERRILVRELSRKQSKKNSHLTSFIINLAVLQ